jgi:hypothetical protein
MDRMLDRAGERCEQGARGNVGRAQGWAHQISPAIRDLLFDPIQSVFDGHARLLDIRRRDRERALSCRGMWKKGVSAISR